MELELELQMNAAEFSDDDSDPGLSHCQARVQEMNESSRNKIAGSSKAKFSVDENFASDGATVQANSFHKDRALRAKAQSLLVQEETKTLKHRIPQKMQSMAARVGGVDERLGENIGSQQDISSQWGIR